MATVLAELKELLAQQLNDTSTLKIQITYTEGGAPLTSSNAVTYNAPVLSGTDYYADISANSTFTLGVDGEVTLVELYDGTTKLASETLTTDNTFPNGGDLIVTSYKITVS